MVAADGCVLGIVDLANSSAPNSQTTSRDHGKVAAISAAFACGRRILNDRGRKWQSFGAHSDAALCSASAPA
jgi:hypothetical protein